MITAIWLLFFSFTHASRLNPDAQRFVTLILFTNTFHYVQQAWRHQGNTMRLIANVDGNILLFVPFGVILANTGTTIALIAGMLSSFTVESIQILTQVGNLDVDDIIWDTSGTIIDLLLVKKHL